MNHHGHRFSGAAIGTPVISRAIRCFLLCRISSQQQRPSGLHDDTLFSAEALLYGMNIVLGNRERIEFICVRMIRLAFCMPESQLGLRDRQRVRVRRIAERPGVPLSRLAHLRFISAPGGFLLRYRCAIQGLRSKRLTIISPADITRQRHQRETVRDHMVYIQIEIPGDGRGSIRYLIDLCAVETLSMNIHRTGECLLHFRPLLQRQLCSLYKGFGSIHDHGRSFFVPLNAAAHIRMRIQRGKNSCLQSIQIYAIRQGV